MRGCSRRRFVASAAAAGAVTAARSVFGSTMTQQSPFKISVINDEISQDFDHSCYVASHDFEMRWIELRSMWETNVLHLKAAQIEEAMQGGRLVGAIMQKDPSEDTPDVTRLHRVGTVTLIHKVLKQPDGTLRLVVQGLSRFRIVEVLATDAGSVKDESNSEFVKGDIT